MALTKNSKFKFFSYLSFGLLAYATIGVGSYFIYKAITTKKTQSDEYREMKNAKTIWFNSGSTNPDPKFANPSWDFKIIVYPYENGEYWLKENGLKKLRKTLNKKLYHGQEIAVLDDIVFGNTNIVDKKSNGLYFPLTKEIFINVGQWEEDNDLSDDKKIEGALSTINHEYGHHISNMYLNTSYAYESWRGDDGYIPINKSVKKLSPTNWNKHFTDIFYKTLNYNSKELTNFPPLYGNYSMSSKISLFDLFWLANAKRKVNWPNDNYQFGVPIDNFKNSNGEIMYPIFWGERGREFNEYRYSLDEIITRQLSQLMNIYTIPNDPMVFGNMVLKRNAKSSIIETFLLDTNSSIQIGINFNSKLKIDIIGLENKNNQWKTTHEEGFYKDYIFGYNQNSGKKVSRAEKIYNAFTNAMGYGKLISNIYGKNKTFAFVDPTTLNINAEYDGDNLNQNEFIISGFAPADVKGVYYGNTKLLKESNLHKFAPINQRINLWNFQRKASAFAQYADPSISKMPKTNKSWIPYITSTFINSSNNYNGEFNWWVDDNNNNKLDKGELRTSKQIIGITNNQIFEQEVINNWIPVSTFRQSWGEGLEFPRIVVDNSGKIRLVRY